MALEREALTHRIEDDLALRNRNWNQLDSHLADYTSLISAGPFNYATLSSGWGGSLAYRKIGQGALSFVQIEASLQAGTSTPSRITTFPDGFRPYYFIPVYAYDFSAARGVLLGLIRDDGRFETIPNYKGEMETIKDNWYRFDLLFMARK